MSTIVFLLEERSAREMLNVILPKILPAHVSFRLIPFEGKQDLERNIEQKIRGWQLPDTKFIILRDKDSEDCHSVKARLVEKCQNANRPDSLVRIACHELESFYLGDLSAVSQAFGLQMPSQQSRKFRNPDSLANAAEELKKLTHNQYQKIEGSRRISNFLATDRTNRSTSFNILLSGIKKTAGCFIS